MYRKALGYLSHPPRLAVRVWPAGAKVKDGFSALESEGGEWEGLRKIETSKYVSKYLQVPRQKKYIYNVVLGIQGVRLEAKPAHSSICYIEL